MLLLHLEYSENKCQKARDMLEVIQVRVGNETNEQNPPNQPNYHRDQVSNSF